MEKNEHLGPSRDSHGTVNGQEFSKPERSTFGTTSEIR